MKSKNILRIALITAILLSVPLLAMQFTNEVNWNFFDFVLAGALIFGTGLAYEFLSSRSGSIVYKIAVGLTIATAFLLIWINLAVGLIGSGPNPANLLYGAVVIIAFLGTMISGFRPRKMANALFITATAQALVPVIALIIRGSELDEPPGLAGVFLMNSIFVALWVGSGLLFRRSGTLNPTP